MVGGQDLVIGCASSTGDCVEDFQCIGGRDGGSSPNCPPVMWCEMAVHGPLNRKTGMYADE